MLSIHCLVTTRNNVYNSMNKFRWYSWTEHQSSTVSVWIHFGVQRVFFVVVTVYVV